MFLRLKNTNNLRQSQKQFGGSASLREENYLPIFKDVAQRLADEVIRKLEQASVTSDAAKIIAKNTQVFVKDHKVFVGIPPGLEVGLTEMALDFEFDNPPHAVLRMTTEKMRAELSRELSTKIIKMLGDKNAISD